MDIGKPKRVWDIPPKKPRKRATDAPSIWPDKDTPEPRRSPRPAKR